MATAFQPWAVAEEALPFLVSASPGERKVLFEGIRERSAPLAVAAVAFREYDEDGREAFLLHALSLLESWGPAAWPALRWIARLQRSECEIFAGLIVRCAGVPWTERLATLQALAGNPHASVRLALLERLGQFPLQEVKPILDRLAADAGPDVRTEATERSQVPD